MDLKIVKIGKKPEKGNIIVIADGALAPAKYNLSKKEIEFINIQVLMGERIISLNRLDSWFFLMYPEKDKAEHVVREGIRKSSDKIYPTISAMKLKNIKVVNETDKADYALAAAEGIALSNYQFIKYFTDKDKKKSNLSKIEIYSKNLDKKDVAKLQIVCEAVYHARDLVNEPLSYLTAVKLSDEIKEFAKDSGYKAEIFNKRKIESLKMGGLLAVNKGSIDPPTFSIMTWKPSNAVNKKPIILVGKGVVFDTGGLSLKPTKDSMDRMKADMAGAAGMIGAMYACAKAKLPVYVIALIPATDNRPSGNAYAPGDVIHMHGGQTVEVLNTDAEGRMILADALSYAKIYDPELVIDMATLTGAAAAAIGRYGIVGMGNTDEKVFDKLTASGENVYERIARLPFWDEYDEQIKSDIADLKNMGGPTGGAITAGKFLEHFTDYPYIHLDIAGTANISSQDSYRGKGGTGSGVRLIFDFLTNY
ncbi:MAG: leucyl aminopeptidase [Chlorobi bacterium]|nr:leucyl aminopeptidase [Chlorobiota bacterium]